MKKKIDYKSIIKGALDKSDFKWMVILDEVFEEKIECNIMFYSEKDFYTEGLPVALMCFLLTNLELQDHKWAYDVLKDELPVGNPHRYTYISDVDARSFEGILDMYHIDPSSAKDIITEYLRKKFGYKDNQIDEIISDLKLKELAREPKKN